MKYTRIFLFLSPLMLLCPPLVPMQDTVAMTMLMSFYGKLLRFFPWNLLMAGICYSYAQQLGRESFRWAGASFVFPFCTPVILGFMPPKYNSTAYAVKQALAQPAAAKGAAGKFDERFPLLQKCLEGKPESTNFEQLGRFAPVISNFEFTAKVDPSSLDRILPEAATRQFTVWPDAGSDGTRLYGAGLVQVKDVDDTTAWLKRIGMSGEKVDVAWRQSDGNMKYFEYYPV